MRACYAKKDPKWNCKLWAKETPSIKDLPEKKEGFSFKEWLLSEISSTSSRYSVDVNYRTNRKEALEAFAKITLGYVSAALKQNGYHVKHVFEETPLRIIVSFRNWDDGEWNLIISFNPEHGFILSRGFYNKGRKSTSVISSEKIDGESAAEITAKARNEIHRLKQVPDRHKEKLKAVPLKTGPKR